MPWGVCTCIRGETVTETCYMCKGIGFVASGVCWVCGGTGSIQTKLDPACPMHGISCRDYTLLAIARPNKANLPCAISARMDHHLKGCAHHRSDGFTAFALGTPVTEELEREALEVIRKYQE